MKDDDVYIQHILDAVDKIQFYTGEMTEEEFKKDEMVQDAVVRRIEIIGEAAKNVSEEVRNEYADIPWQDIAGMRDNLIHKYFGVDLDQVWETVERDIPELKGNLMDESGN